MNAAPLKILVVGSSGLIGGALTRALVQQGHTVVAAVRTVAPQSAGPAMGVLQIDLASVPPAHWWARQLGGVDLVINAVGIFRERGYQRFDTLHRLGPSALFEGAVQAGVPRAVQISALGSDAQAESAYHRSKYAADEALRALPLTSLIVQPSLVYSPAGSSTRLFHGLAALPILALPRSAARVQPLHLEDLVQAVLRWIGDPAARSTTLAAVGPQPVEFEAYLAALRRSLGWAHPARILRVTPRTAVAAAGVLGLLPGSTVDAEAVRMLLRGNTADATGISVLLGRSPREPAAFIAPADRTALHQAAVLQVLLPLGRASVALVWLWTAAVSFGLYPVAGSLDLLADFGLRGWPAATALYAGALLDLALGVATLFAPRRHMGRVWCAQLLLIAGYTALITLRMPHWWLHPYGPLSKNLPMLALIGLLWATQRRS